LRKAARIAENVRVFILLCLQYNSLKMKAVVLLSLICLWYLLTGAAPAQNEWEDKTKKIESYGYNFRSVGTRKSA